MAKGKAPHKHLGRPGGGGGRGKKGRAIKIGSEHYGAAKKGR